MMHRLRMAFALLGRRVLLALAIASLGAFLLSTMELAIAMFVQLFLQSLGLLAQGIELPGWLTALLPTPTHVVLALVVIGAGRAVAQVMVANATSVGLEVTSQRLRLLAVYELLLHPKKPYVPLSRLTLQLGEHFTKAGYFGYAVAGMVGGGIQALVLMGLLFVTAPREALFAIVGLGFTGILVRVLQRRSAVYAEKVPEQLTNVTRGIERVARNMFLVRALRTHAREHAEFRAGIDAYANHATRAGFWGAISGSTVPFAGTLLIVVMVFASQNVFHTAGLTLLSFLYLFVRFAQALSTTVSQVSVGIQYWPQFRASLDYLEELGVDSMQLATADTLAETQRETASRAPSVHFDGVTFGYSKEAGPIVEDFSCHVEAGQQIAVVGPSGAGKSTLLALLLGILDPTRGSVRIDQQSPEAYFSAGHRIGYVGAEAYLVAGSLADNLCYGLAQRPSDEQMWSALRRARLEAAVRALPDGLSHRMREDGAGLSAGQKQRLCLARALLAEPGLLVLDEASANVDEATEQEIAETLRELKGSVTVVIVSHRPIILQHADLRLALRARAREAAAAPVHVESVTAQPI